MFVTIILLFVTICIALVLFTKWYQKTYYEEALKLPGPPSKFLLGNILDIGFTVEDSYNNINKLTKKYGSCFGLWISSFSFKTVISEPNYVEQILNENSDKGSIGDLLRPWLGDGLLTGKVEIWKVHRKLIRQSFHVKLLEQFLDVFSDSTNTFINVVKRQNNGPIDICSLLPLYALDVISETIMGVQLKAQNNQNVDYVHAIDNYLDLFIMKFFSVLRRFDSYYRLTKDYKHEQEALNIIQNKTRSVILKRENERKIEDKNNNVNNEFGIKKKIAFMDLLLDLKDNGIFTEYDVKNQTNTFLVAGHHTTSTALSFILFELAKHPDLQAKIVDEVDYVIDDINGSITIQKLQELKFTDRVIKEGLRLHTITPMTERILSEDVDVGKYKFKKNSSVLINICGVHHNENYYPDPYKFDPDRFLPENFSKLHAGAFIPFGTGSRNCIGQRFAMFQMKIFLAIVMKNFVLSAVIPEHIPKLGNNGVLKSLNGLPINFKERH